MKILISLCFCGVSVLGALIYFQYHQPITAVDEQPKVESREALLEQLRSVSELTTSVAVVQVVVPVSQDRQIAGLTVGKIKLLMVFRGEVRAGIDLSGVRISEDAILLPGARILDVKLDVSKTKTWNYEREGLFAPDTAPALMTASEKTALTKVREEACESGVLQQAEKQAAIAVEKLVGDPRSGSLRDRLQVKVSPSSGCS